MQSKDEKEVVLKIHDCNSGMDASFQKKEPTVTVLEIQDGVIDIKDIFERVERYVKEKRNG